MTTFALRSRSSGGPSVTGPFLRGPVAVWVPLYFNVMTYVSIPMLVPIPHMLGQAATQGMLLVALLLALLANPGIVVRPNLFLTVLTLMVIVAVTVSIHNDFMISSSYRAARFVLFISVLWLLTPWWGRSDLPLLRAHLLCLKMIIGFVWLGALLAPGAAFSTTESRLSGAIWPIPPPQVAHYAGVLFGCTVVLWLCGVVGGRGTALTVLASGSALLATHTRTALLGTVLGLVVAGASLFLGQARVRRTAAAITVLGVVTWAVFSPLIVSWLTRGQNSEDISNLTGRTKVWNAVSQRPRTMMEEFFGTGLANKSYKGLAIDSTWVSTHLELGRAGIALVIAFLLVLFLTALTRPAGPRRALALFFVVYCVAASFTETGLGDSSPYLLDLTVAASLLARPPDGSRRATAGPAAAPRDVARPVG